jgi:hypothetical protein
MVTGTRVGVDLTIAETTVFSPATNDELRWRTTPVFCGLTCLPVTVGSREN